MKSCTLFPQFEAAPLIFIPNGISYFKARNFRRILICGFFK